MPDTITKLAYQALQDGKIYFSLGHRAIATQVRQWLKPNLKAETVPVSPELLEQFARRRDELYEADLKDAEAGVYPQSVLFDNPWQDFFLFYPALWFDLPKIWERVEKGDRQRFDEDINTQGYPRYYLQNFHYQTNGYLSDLSANLYDLQVELLFSGTADAMRRRILAPLKRGLEAMQTAKAGSQSDRLPIQTDQQLRVLDVACGTGRTLKMLGEAFPEVSLHGVDLSPTYLRKANQLLSESPRSLPQLTQGNAESLPYRDNYFDGLTCVFLFHELPGPVRQTVIEDCFRVTKPGGCFIICDSIQMLDSPELEPMMANFPAIFHEPYYRDYIYDDLNARLAAAGFCDITTQVHLVSKYWIAHKPVSPD